MLRRLRGSLADVVEYLQKLLLRLTAMTPFVTAGSLNFYLALCIIYLQFTIIIA